MPDSIPVRVRFGPAGEWMDHFAINVSYRCLSLLFKVSELVTVYPWKKALFRTPNRSDSEYIIFISPLLWKVLY